MLKRFSHFIACLLLVLMPLQALAAANMLVCNSVMQAEKNAEFTVKQSEKMACHQHIAKSDHTKNSKQKESCKTNCFAICASLNGFAAMPSALKLAPFAATTTVLAAYTQTYASITQASLQRPPIFLN